MKRMTRRRFFQETAALTGAGMLAPLVDRMPPGAVTLPRVKDHSTVPDRIERFGPPAGVFDKIDLPSPRDYLHYALSLPLTTAVVGVDALPTLDSIIANALALQLFVGTSRRRCPVFSENPVMSLLPG